MSITVDYNSLFDAISAVFEAEDWKKFSIREWVTDEGEYKIPEGSYDQGFNIKMLAIRPSTKSHDNFRVQIQVEFILDVLTDTYLAKIKECQSMILSLRSITFTGKVERQDVSDKYADLTYFADFGILTFSELYFEVK